MEYGEVRESRIVPLNGTVDDDLANKVVAELLLLSADERSDILLLINSPGGSLSAGLAIYDTMEYILNDVATCTVGLAAGMGQFLLTAGALGKRFAVRDAHMVMVEVRADDGGPYSDALLASTRQRVAELAALHMGRDPEFVQAAWKANPQREFEPEQARRYGLIDHIVDRAPGRR